MAPGALFWAIALREREAAALRGNLQFLKAKRYQWERLRVLPDCARPLG